MGGTAGFQRHLASISGQEEDVALGAGKTLL